MSYELAQIVKAMNEGMAAKSKMRIGATIKHPDGYMVKVTDGCYLNSVYGRVSNFWYWKRVKPDGTLSRRTYHGYGW